MTVRNIDKMGIPYYAKILIVLLSKIFVISNKDSRMLLLQRLHHIHHPTILSFVNAHAFNLMCSDKFFADALLTSDILLRDGIGLSILLSLNGIRPGLNMNGTDFIPVLLKHLKKYTIGLLGTSDHNLNITAFRLAQHDCQVIAKLNGFYPEMDYVHFIKTQKPQVVLLGMGMPKQERVAILLKRALDYPCLIINGGAVIDYISQQVLRAPRWIRVLRLEWLFRMLVEPKRLWRRYILGNPLFLSKVVLASIGKFFMGHK